MKPRPSLSSLARPASAPVGIAVAWILIPTAVLLVYSALAQPIYLDRYLTFTVPGMALLLAVCVRGLSRNAVQAVGLLAVLAIVALPNYLD